MIVAIIPMRVASRNHHCQIIVTQLRIVSDVCYLGLSNCSSSMTCVPDIIHKSFTCTRLGKLILGHLKHPIEDTRIVSDYTEDCGDLLMRYKTNLTNGVYEVSTSKLCPKCTKKIYCDSVLNGGWTVSQSISKSSR